MRKPVPSALLFEPSQKCNASCPFCYHWQEALPEPELSADEIYSVLEQSYALGCRLLLLMGGEPFIGRHFAHTLKRSKELGFCVSVITNGSVIETLGPKFAPYIDNLTISVDFPDERMDSSRGIPGLSSKIKRGVKAIRPYFEDIKLNCNLSIDNQDDITALAELAKDWDCPIHFRLLTNESTELNLPRLDAPDTRKQVVDQILDLKKQGYPIVSNRHYLRAVRNLEPFTCLVNRFVINVDSVGRIYTSCPNHEGTKDLIFGSIREHLLRDIWYGQVAQDFRKQTPKCQPRLDCYTACIYETSMIIKPSIGYLLEQIISNNGLVKFLLSKGRVIT